MSDLLRDLRYAVRMLTRRPALAVMSTVSLATGIALTVTTYSLLNALFAQSSGIVHPEQVVRVHSPMPNRAGVDDLRRELAPVADAAGAGLTAAKSVVFGTEERLVVELVTDNYFSVLGLVPAQGRSLSASDLTRPPGPPPVVISHALWQSRFFGQNVRGRVFQLGTEPVLIVGVAPRGFSGMVWSGMYRVDAWALVGTLGNDKAKDRFFYVFARLRPGATPIQVQRTVAATVRRPDFVVMVGSKEQALVVRESNSRFGSSFLIGVLTAVVGLLLVVACANVAGLLLARLDERRRELAIRTALGAGHWPIVRQLLAEGVLLSSAGSLAGLLVATWLTRLAVHGAGFFGFTAVEAVFDRSVLLLVCGLTTLETLAVSMAPIYFATRVDVSTCLKGDMASARTGRTRVGFRDVFVTVQLAIAFMLLVAAGLAMKSSERHTRSAAALLRDDVVVASLKLPEAGTERSVTVGTLLDRARAVPGARAAAFADMPNPRQRSTRVIHARRASSSPDGGTGWTSVTASANAVSADYFRIVRLRIVSGRTFSPDEESGAARSVVLTMSLARRLWPDANVLGRQVHLDETSDPPWDVVGLVEDPPVIGEGNTGFCFVPVAHSRRASVSMLVEAVSPRLALAPAVASLARSTRVTGANEPETAVISLADFVRQNDGPFQILRYITEFTLALGLLACALTLAGFYATVSHLFARRTAEIGIRIALGAGRWQVRWLVLRRALVLAWTATLVGLPIALAEGLAVPPGVFDTRWTPLDPLLGAALAVSLVAVLAAYVPARRASAVDPTVALRCE